MPKGNSVPKTAAEAARKFIKANPDANGKAIIAGVKENYGFDITIHNVYNQRAALQKVKKARVAKRLATMMSKGKTNSKEFTVTVESIRSVKAVSDLLGGPAHVQAVLDLLEELQ